MIPYKYKERKLKAICLRNLKEQCSYFISILPKNNEFAPFSSKPSGPTSNPIFEISETDINFMNAFYDLEDC